LNGYEVILVELKRTNGLTEYANFPFNSWQQQTNYSYWNIEQYPAGDYLNFQVWDLLQLSLSYCKRYHFKMQQQNFICQVVDDRVSVL
jgi:hypothetical protein